MNTLLADIRYALRKLRRQPGFLAVAVLTLSLGIGATTTVFSWIQSVLWRPFPGTTNPSELVVVCTQRGTAMFETMALPNIRDLRAMTNVFAGVIGSQITPACLGEGEKQYWVYGQIAVPDFFEVLGVRPALGRFFSAADGEAAGSAPVLVLSHALWQNRFGGNPAVLGQAVTLNRSPFTIIGVAPADFPGTMSGLACDFWAPVAMHREVAHFGNLDARMDHWLHTVARLRPGMGLSRAQAAADIEAKRLQAAYPGENEAISFKLLPPWKSPWGAQAFFLPVLSVLMAVSVGVLLIVAANIANLLLARAISRRREMAVRLAVGAGVGHLVRQLLTESLVLAACGGVGGTLAAHWGMGLLASFVPATYLPVRSFVPEWSTSTLAFTTLVTLMTGVLFGLVPAFQAARTTLADVLKEGGRGVDPGSPHLRLRAALVISEVALALALLTGAGLCLKGFQAALRMDPGFEPRGLALAGMRLGAHGYDEPRAKTFYHQLQERLSRQPGVRDAALANWFPLGFEGGGTWRAMPEGYQPTPDENLSFQHATISPRYFQTMRIPLDAGRDFNDQDTVHSTRVVIINDTLARRFWPGQEAVGQKLTINGAPAPHTVVGVVRTGKYRTLNEPSKGFLYTPFQQGAGLLDLGIVVRAEGADPAALMPALRRAVKELDSGVELWTTITYDDFIQAAFMAPRMASSLMVALSGVALVLAALGIYAVMSWFVGQRRHEIGVRLALGAQAANVLHLVLGRGLRLIALGAVVGLAAAAAGARFLTSFLHGVSPWDPLIFAGVALILGTVALAACLVPAWQALRVDPTIALRQE